MQGEVAGDRVETRSSGWARPRYGCDPTQRGTAGRGRANTGRCHANVKTDFPCVKAKERHGQPASPGAPTRPGTGSVPQTAPRTATRPRGHAESPLNRSQLATHLLTEDTRQIAHDHTRGKANFSAQSDSKDARLCGPRKPLPRSYVLTTLRM